MLAAGASPSWAALANVDNTVALTSCTASRAAIAIAVRWIGSISRSNTSIVACSPAHHLGQRIVGEHDHQIDVAVVEGAQGPRPCRSRSPRSRRTRSAGRSTCSASLRRSSPARRRRACATESCSANSPYRTTAAARTVRRRAGRADAAGAGSRRVPCARTSGNGWPSAMVRARAAASPTRPDRPRGVAARRTLPRPTRPPPTRPPPVEVRDRSGSCPTPRHRCRQRDRRVECPGQEQPDGPASDGSS